ncbi:hypothetical protein BHE74_00039790, partial [Ensete ventricosum]
SRSVRPGRGRLCCLLLAAAPARGVAVVGRPCKGPGHGWQPPFLAAFAAKTK